MESRFIEFKKNKRAVSPSISTVILTGTIVVLLISTVAFANNFLDSRMAETEFSTIGQFMQTVGLQIDDVAWTAGRTQTVRYVSKYGQVNFESVTLNYSIYVKESSEWQLVLTNTTGIILFNMPVSKYSVGNGYFERIFPSDNSFLQKGPSAPITHLFIIEKLPMVDGNFIRVAVAPSFRMLNSTIIGAEQKNYSKFYLVSLVPGIHPHNSQSITITGKNVRRSIRSGVEEVKINVTFPNDTLGFNSEFFKFKSIEETFILSSDSIVEFYISEVVASIGLHL